MPLASQDAGKWAADLIAQAERLLTQAAAFGRFACEAAIQSVQAQRAITGVTAHEPLRILYDFLLAHVPSVGVAVARAAALIESGDVKTAQTALDDLDPSQLASYQPYWVTRARLADATGDSLGRRAHLQRALGLTEDAGVRAFLRSVQNE